VSSLIVLGSDQDSPLSVERVKKTSPSSVGLSEGLPPKVKLIEPSISETSPRGNAVAQDRKGAFLDL